MKVLFVGLGGAGQRLLRVFHKVTSGQTRNLAYRTLARAGVITPAFQWDQSGSLENQYGLTTFPSLDAALQENPDCAVIANPTSMHIETALTVTRAGCPFLMEKPLGHDWEGVDTLIELTREKKLVSMVGFQTRFHPCLRWLKDQLQKGRLGRIMGVWVKTASFLPDWHPYENFRELYAAQRELGGGVILTESHELDYLIWLLGMPRTVFAAGGNLGPFKLDVEDTVNLSLVFESNSSDIPVQMQLSFMEKPICRLLEIYTEKGRIRWDSNSWDRIILQTSPTGEIEEISFPGWDRNRLFEEEVKYFINCLREKVQSVPNVEEAAQGLKVMLACQRSLKTGQSIKVDEFQLERVT